MDKKLLDALNNLSLALEEIAISLKKSDKGDKSATTTALQSGKLDKSLKSIDEGVKRIQSDNKRILKSQQTIIELIRRPSPVSKVREAAAVPSTKDKPKASPLDKVTDPKQKSKLKDGLASIMMIAVGVLAIGIAFKLVGGINFGSVIALAIALPLVAIAFEKIAQMKDLKAGQIKNILLIVVGISLAIAASSFILSIVRPVGIFKLLTAIAIGAMFAVMAPGLGKLSKSVSDIPLKGLVKLPLVMIAVSLAIAASSFVLNMVKPVGIFKLFTAIMIAAMFTAISYGLGKLMKGLSEIPLKGMLFLPLLPIIMPVVALAIALSSYALQLVQPVGIFKLITAVFIAAMFAVVAYSLDKLIKGLGEIKNPAKAAIIAATLPLILVAVAGAIALASLPLSMIQPIGLFQFFTAIMIAIIFIPISFALPFISRAIKDISPVKVLIMVGVLIAMAGAIWVASEIFGKVTPVPFATLLNIAAITVVLALVGVVLGFTMDFLGKKDTKKILFGALHLVIISAAIMISSWILSVGKYENAPPIGWSIALSLTMVLLSIPVAILGVIGLPIVTMGAIGLVIVATAITAASYILSFMDPKIFYLIADAMTYFMKRVADAVAYGLKVIAPSLKIFLDTVGGSVIKFVKGILPPIVKAVKEFFKEVVKPLLQFLVDSLPAIGKFITTIIDSVIPAIKIIIDGLVELAKIISGVFKTIAEGIKTAGEVIVKIINAIVEGVKAGLSGVKDIIKQLGDTIVSVINAISSGIEKVGDKLKEIFTSIGDAISKILDGIKGVITSIGNTIEKIVNSIVGGVERLAAVGSVNLIKAGVNIVAFLTTITGAVAAFSNSKFNFANMEKITKLFDSLQKLSSTTKELSTLPNIFNSIATSIDKLSASISKLTGGLDIDKLDVIKNLAGSVVLLSLMDPDQFSKMMTTLEEKAKMFVDSVNDASKAGGTAKEATGPSAKVTPVKSGPAQPAKATKTMDDLYEIMNSVNMTLATISSDSTNISKYVDSIKGGDVNLKSKTKS